MGRPGFGSPLCHEGHQGDLGPVSRDKTESEGQGGTMYASLSSLEKRQDINIYNIDDVAIDESGPLLALVQENRPAVLSAEHSGHPCN